MPKRKRGGIANLGEYGVKKQFRKRKSNDAEADFETAVMGATIWLVPSVEETIKLQRIMDMHPSSSEASYPKFQPHITLAALPASTSTPISTIRSSVPESQPSLQADFKSIDIGTHYFRSVFLSIKPTADLWALHKIIHTTLNVQPRTPLFPHVSLCYIDDEDAKTGERELFLEGLDQAGKVKRNGSEDVSLNCGLSEQEEWIAGFEGCEIWIMNCDGPVEGWQLIEKIPLISSSQ